MLRPSFRSPPSPMMRQDGVESSAVGVSTYTAALFGEAIDFITDQRGNPGSDSVPERRGRPFDFLDTLTIWLGRKRRSGDICSSTCDKNENSSRGRSPS